MPFTAPLPRSPRLGAWLLPLTLLVGACGSDFAVAGAGKDMPGRAEDTGAEGADGGGDGGDGGGETADPEPTDSGEPSGDTGDGTPDDDITPPDGDPAPADDCTETSDLIYVIERDTKELMLFDPAAQAFTTLGKLTCGGSATPGSMAISRDGHGFVRFSDNRVYDVDLATLACTETAYSDRDSGFGSFGMGYATNDSETWRDTLYIANESHLATLDTSTWAVTDVGRIPSQSELSGNAAGELWAFLPLQTPAQLARLDKTTGEALEVMHLDAFPDASDLDAFAFATWGGQTYLFVRVYGMGESTDVYEVNAAGDMTKILNDVGFDVVGAGVSTCAPTAA